MEKLTDQSLMKFGKHEGQTLESIPAPYFLWLWDNGLYAQTHNPLHHYILESFSALESEAKDYIVQHRPTK